MKKRKVILNLNLFLCCSVQIYFKENFWYFTQFFVSAYANFPSTAMPASMYILAHFFLYYYSILPLNSVNQNVQAFLSYRLMRWYILYIIRVDYVVGFAERRVKAFVDQWNFHEFTVRIFRAIRSVLAYLIINRLGVPYLFEYLWLSLA